VPIFMDRHDLRGAKAEDVAEAHRRDVDIQDRHGVKYMAYWFDENNGAAFCLVHAPDPATAERVHREAHGEIPNAIIPVDLATVEAFLGRIGDPRAAPGAVAPAVDSGLRAVMFTDIVGSTEMTARLGDSAALELVRAHDALVRRGLEAYGGAHRVRHVVEGGHNAVAGMLDLAPAPFTPRQSERRSTPFSPVGPILAGNSLRIGQRFAMFDPRVLTYAISSVLASITRLPPDRRSTWRRGRACGLRAAHEG
jgi:class 3 adenylate cyclase